MTNIAIVEDNDAEAQALADGIKRFMDGAKEKYTLRRFDNAEAFLENYSSRYDLVFMDIRLPMMDGMQAAERLRKMDGDAALVFVTDMAQLASKGYKVDALDFIVKPVSYDELSLALMRARERASRMTDVSVMVQTAGSTIRLGAKRISYVEVYNHKLIYHLGTGDEVEAYGQLKDAENALGGAGFFKCSRCYLVNLRYVTAVREFTVDVGGDELQVSHPKRKELLAAIAAYYGGSSV